MPSGISPEGIGRFFESPRNAYEIARGRDGIGRARAPTETGGRINSATHTATGESQMDAIALLKVDHDKVKRLLNELETTTERGVKTRAELFSTIKGELTLHEIVEEEIFYPELKSHPKAKDIVLEGYEEHHVVDTLMAELEGLDVADETWGAKATVMKENIEHHIEEEEGEMFRQARQVFDAAELDDLGRRMEERKVSAGRELGIPVATR
jgi:hemerythrin-like domain-containing protein